MRVFVLSTGRCGSTTFERACRHIANFTAGHETNKRRVGERRFDYPDQHIESDNRLSWFLGGLQTRFDHDQTFYVHLTRDPRRVAASYAARWDSGFHSGIIRAFAQGIVMRKQYQEEQRIRLARFYVSTVNENIAAFLADKPHRLDFPLERAEELFSTFWRQIGAEGDLDAALGEFQIRHNASPSVNPT